MDRRHSQRIREQINQREQEEIERLEAEYAGYAERLAQLDTTIAEVQAGLARLQTQTEKTKAEKILRKLEGQRAKRAAKVAERDERVVETRRRAEDDRREVDQVASELGALYGDPDELLKHARVVESDIAKRYFMRVAKRTTNLASTNKTQVRAFRFPVPLLPEQEQIVAIVAAAKVKLQGLTQKESALQQLKKSLMHDLLTGKVRIPSAMREQLYNNASER